MKTKRFKYSPKMEIFFNENPDAGYFEVRMHPSEFKSHFGEVEYSQSFFGRIESTEEGMCISDQDTQVNFYPDESVELGDYMLHCIT